MSNVTLDEVWALFKETDRKFQETALRFKETDRKFQETDLKFKETDRELNKLGKQIGGLGDKFGYFTEGMALPSMERILTEQFGMTTIAPRVRVRKGGENIEIDVLAHANDDVNTVIVVEIKSRVKGESIKQLQKMMERFREFFPEHKDKALIGILAGVDWDREIKEQAQDAGFLTASIHDEVFELTSEDGFKGRRW